MSEAVQWVELPAEIRAGRPLRWGSHYHFARHRATLPDYAAEVRTYLRETARMRAAGRDVQSDHIVPILNPIVCGLNVPWNLQRVTRRANRNKCNHVWPDMPVVQEDAFGADCAGVALTLSEPHQLALRL